MQNGQKIGLTMLTAIVFSSMVGAGIFSLPQNMAEVAGVDAIIIAWLITGVGILFLAGCFLHLSRLKPELDGGVYTYAKTIWRFGRIFFGMGLLAVCHYWRGRLFGRGFCGIGQFCRYAE